MSDPSAIPDDHHGDQTTVVGSHSSSTELAIPEPHGDADTLTAALAYAEAGFYVLPVAAGTKNPGTVVGKHWQQKSGRDPKQIVAWFAGTDHGLALHVGRSDLVAVDVDNPAEVPPVLRKHLERADVPYQSTRPDQLHRGHYLFRRPLGRKLGNSVGKLGKGWGEIRGDNGIIMLAPSTHPNGGEYRWERVGVVPVLPDEVADLLPDAGDAKDAASDAQVHEFMAKHTGNEDAALLDNVIKKWHKDVHEIGASRHDTTVVVLPWAMEEAAAGYYPAKLAADSLWAAFQDAVADNPSRPAKSEFWGMLAWAVSCANAVDIGAVRTRVESGRIKAAEQMDAPSWQPDDEEIVPEDNAGALEALEGDFWSARPYLELIYTAALNRMASPWAVLACVVARVLALVPPDITLPPLVGGKGSLNWFAALMATSGGGKDAAMAVAEELVPDPMINVRPIGSGEGMIECYARRALKDGEDAVTAQADWVTSVLFSAEEIDSLAAMGNRSGQTTMPVLRQGFSGQRLGFSYKARTGDQVAPHTYRMTLVASVQPDRAGVLFEDAGGGTPQRFMWFPATDKRISANPPPWPEDPTFGPKRLSLPTVAQMYDAAKPHVFVPEIAATIIRQTRAAAMAGEQNALDGHALFCREKFAYALALMDGRVGISEADWALSGIAVAVSDWCRNQAQQGYQAGRERQSRERGQLRAYENDERDVVAATVQQKRMTRLCGVLVRALDRNGPMTEPALRHALASGDRVWFTAALKHLANAEQITKEGQTWKLK